MQLIRMGDFAFIFIEYYSFQNHFTMEENYTPTPQPDSSTTPSVLEDGSNDLKITDEIELYLKETAKWGKFLSILGIVMYCLIAILMLGFGSFFMNIMSRQSGFGGGGFGFGLIIFYLGIYAVFLLWPSIMLYKFATKMNIALTTRNQDAFTQSFLQQRSLARFYAIVTIIGLALMVLMILLFSAGFMMGGYR